MQRKDIKIGETYAVPGPRSNLVKAEAPWKSSYGWRDDLYEAKVLSTDEPFQATRFGQSKNVGIKVEYVGKVKPAGFIRDVESEEGVTRTFPNGSGLWGTWANYCQERAKFHAARVEAKERRQNVAAENVARVEVIARRVRDLGLVDENGIELLAATAYNDGSVSTTRFNGLADVERLLDTIERKVGER